MIVRQQVEQRASLLLYLEVGVRGRKDSAKRCPRTASNASSNGSFPYRIVKKILWLNYSSKTDVCLRPSSREPCRCSQQRKQGSPVVAENRVQQVREQGPTAPSLSLVLFNSEEHSDLAFFVGREGEAQWRFPAHSFVVSPASPVLEGLVSRCRSVLDDGIEQQTDGLVQDMRTANDICLITLAGTQPEVFQNVLRFIYTKKINFLSVGSCLSIMSAAQKYQVSSLIPVCLEYLLDNVTERNVLQVLSGIKNSGAHSPSGDEDNLRNELTTRCFSLIDDNADTVLASEAFENLDQSLMMEIATRDSLRASSETQVFGALLRWSCQECKRRRLEILVENKRRVLGPALYSTRFLLMTQEEFRLGPVASGLLPDQEQKYVLGRLSGDSSAVLPKHLHCRGRDLPLGVPPLAQGGSRGSTATSEQTTTTTTTTVNTTSTTAGKKPKRNRLLNGLGDIVIGVFTLLD